MTSITTDAYINQTTFDSYTSPITINIGIKITLIGNITDTLGKYFIIGGTGITFDGNGYTIDVSSVVDYPGLILSTNPTYTATIQNLGVLSTSTLLVGAGWIVQGNGFDAGITCDTCYSTGNFTGDYTGVYICSGGIFGYQSSGTAINCYSTGDNFGGNGFGGGIFGSYSTSSSTATNCYSTGAINSGGGIFGGNGSGTATNCYSTGTINFGGGIFSQRCSGTATNCYSTGDISNGSGGIFGANSTGTATNCYSTGAINYQSGGIFGSSSSGIATNCYSTGNMGDYAGGIFGPESSGTATNCYSTGLITGSNGRGICGYNRFGLPTGTANYCYCIGGTNIGGATYSTSIGVLGDWLDASANLTIGYDNADAWYNFNTNVPWLLGSFTSAVYSPSSVTTSSTSYTSGVGLFGATIVYTGSAVSPTYTVLSSTNTVPTVGSNGALTFSNITGNTVVKVLCYYDLTAPGFFSLDLTSTTGFVGYNINTFTLTFQSNPGPNPVPCFLVGAKIKTGKNEYSLVQDLKEGHQVYTPDGRLVPILKIDHFTCTAGKETSPYLVQKGFFGAVEDLYLSPDHGVLCEDETIRLVKHLGFMQNKTLATLHYYHLTLPNFFTDHVVANGVACESYGGNFLLQSNGNMDAIAFSVDLLRKVYCKQTSTRKHLTSRRYNVLFDHFIGGNHQMENPPKYTNLVIL